jgi:hypothetical protein
MSVAAILVFPSFGAEPEGAAGSRHRPPVGGPHRADKGLTSRMSRWLRQPGRTMIRALVDGAGRGGSAWPPPFGRFAGGG